MIVFSRTRWSGTCRPAAFAAACAVAACSDGVLPVEGRSGLPVLSPAWRSTNIASGLEGTIASLDGRAFIANGRRLRFINPLSGEELWSSDTNVVRLGVVERFVASATRLVVMDLGVAVFDRATRQVLWRLPGSTWGPDVAGMANAIAATDLHVYLATDGGLVERRDAATGALQWRITVPGPCPTICRPRAIAVAGDTLWVAGERRDDRRGDQALLLALDAATGAVLWDGVDLGTVGFGPAATLVDSLLVLHHEGSQQLVAFNVRRRTVQWRLNTPAPWAGPTDVKVEGQTIYASGGDQHVYAVSLTTGAVQWQTYIGGSQLAIAICPDRIVSYGFVLHWLDKRTGKHLAYAVPDDGGLFHEGFAVVGDRVLAQTGRTVYAFACQV